MGDLKTEIRQTKAFPTLHEEAFLNVERTAALLADAFEQMLKPHGITGTQYNVLRILRGAGNNGLCRNEVRDRLVTRMPDVTRLLDRMEDAGLIVRERSTEDRRVVSTQLTQQGRKLVDSLDAAVTAEHEARLGHLNATQLRTLIELLTLVRDGNA
jgi:DNA-binding MarR family transcriptional regulator